MCMCVIGLWLWLFHSPLPPTPTSLQRAGEKDFYGTVGSYLSSTATCIAESRDSPPTLVVPEHFSRWIPVSVRVDDLMGMMSKLMLLIRFHR
mmetsp:Transcript_42119/g.71234  ORF Transcript_42119/g.71234 Transcript_42119/m.71234 type:complete len:92 (+) Transcript_42119:342-617(+)